jgi:hypothetical protein
MTRGSVRNGQGRSAIPIFMRFSAFLKGV